MAWWSWLLIWGALIAALIAMLAWFAYRLVRKALHTIDALERLGDQIAALERHEAEPPAGRFRPAVFAETAEVRLAHEAAQTERRHRRQLRRDTLIARGKLLQHAPLTQRTDPHA